MVRVSCVYVKSLLYALFIMLVLYAAWLSLLCNLDFSCFKSLYYVPFALVVLVCCSLPPLERERLKYMSKTSYRQIVSRLSFRIHTHTPSTRRTEDFKPGLHSVRRSTQTEIRKRIYADTRVMAFILHA